MHRPARVTLLALLLAASPAGAQEPIDIQQPARPASPPYTPLPPPVAPRPPSGPVPFWQRVPSLQPLISVEVGPSFPLLRSAAMLGTGLLVGTHAGFQFRSNQIFSVGPEVRVSYSRWGNTESFLDYPVGGATSLLLATLGLRATFHLGSVDLWGGARVGFAQLWRSVEGFPRLGDRARGVAYDLEVGAAVMLRRWIGLGLALGVAEPGVGANIGMADFRMVGLSLTGNLFFRPRSRL